MHVSGKESQTLGFLGPSKFSYPDQWWKVMEMLLSEIEIVTRQQLWTMKDNTDGDLKV